MTTLLRAAPALLTGAVLLAPFVLPGDAAARSCREQLDRFERALDDSGLAAADADAYAELERAAEEASELRDEALCMERVAELEAELAAAQEAAPGAGGAGGEDTAGTAPPAAPLLHDPPPVD